MNIKTFLLLAVSLLLATGSMEAKQVDYSNDTIYARLRLTMHNAFNTADSLHFFPAVKELENYLLSQGDLHGYYTQRCNEIVFQMNQQRIFEAYKLARELSKELREKKVDTEMYMAYNMLGHINRYCGNKEAARENWHQVLKMMEEQGYYSSMPPIYMNIVNVALNDSPKEADSLLEKAKEIAMKYSPERVFDIETRHALSFYYRGDIDRFLKGYEAYKQGEKEGKTSVHGRSMEVYYLASQGRIDEAVELARKELGDEGKDAIAQIYEKAGRWQEAFKSLQEETAANDSIDNVVLTNSVMGIRDEMMLYEKEREVGRSRTLALLWGILFLLALVVALAYIIVIRRKHLREIKVAYERALESDRMKSAFIQNVSHEVRTPLNIISGFAQVIADPQMETDKEERQHIAKMMLINTHHITSLIDEMLELSVNESSGAVDKSDQIALNSALRKMLKESEGIVSPGVELRYESNTTDNHVIQSNQNVIKRIVGVLLDNAAKYTQEGSITLRLKVQAQQMLITVEDTGCGIPEEEAEHIFERFVKLDSFKQGIGLGLPLCRILAERLGGKVVLDTSYRHGSRFVVTLPL